MKYSAQMLVVFLSLYTLAEFFGLYVAETYANIPLPYGIEQPQVPESSSVWYIAVSILLITIVFLILSKYSMFLLLRIWYYTAVFLTSTIALSIFIGETGASIIAVALILLKIFSERLMLHNFVEVLVYAGVTPIIAPIFSLNAVILLLIIMSIYDFISVYYTKHMVKLAKAQDKARIFSGIIIRYKEEQAILGGGDIVFPLIFASVVNKAIGAIAAIFSIYGAVLGLLVLVVIGKEKKYYPALPFITTGLLIGFLIGRMI